MNAKYSNYLDCSNEVSAFPDSLNTSRQWLATDINTQDWLHNINSAALAEIHVLAEHVQTSAIRSDFSELQQTDFDIPNCRQLFSEIRSTIDDGVGFAVADKLPTDEYPADVMARVFFVLGQLVGTPVSQKHSGQMIYDVRDSGAAFGYGVRGSVTTVELNFHTDNAFGQATPEYVGLFCRHPAKEGGVSRFCSLYALHNYVYQTSPEALRRLYQPMLFDRQMEHAEGDPPVTLAPYFSWHTSGDGKQRMRARANASLVRKGYQVAGIDMDADLVHALDVIDEISSQEQFWFEAALEKGQIQYLNNREVGHYRSEFVDFDEDNKKRHLYRLWHRNEGHHSYHGTSPQ